MGLYSVCRVLERFKQKNSRLLIFGLIGAVPSSWANLRMVSACVGPILIDSAPSGLLIEKMTVAISKPG